jgi:O-methyltransferase domain
MLIGINSGDAPAIAAAYDFSSYSHVADIGGATGYLLTTVLASHPGPRGTLFDLPHNQASAGEFIQSRGMADRVTFCPGSFFETIPGGCDLYMLSHVIHDWSEEQCLTILGNCHRAMSAGSRLLIIEMVLSEGNAFHPGKGLDITMLTLAGGQERTEPEYRALLEKANFQLTRVIPTNSAVSIVEASL